MRQLIKTDGTVIELEDPLTIRQITKMLNAEFMDNVNLPDHIHVMILDDDGYIKDLPVNEKATEIYHTKCIPGTTHAIRGDVVIAPDQDFAKNK